MMTKQHLRTLISNWRWLPLVLALAACQHTAPTGLKVGKPYVVDGKTYFPEYDPTYDKIGEASWYGPGFQGKYTASGEVYNQNDLTAAHPTLPMPSMIRVTNLANGRHLIVRVNDRGPFKSNRIIDLSKKAAHELGITSTARVRVQFLKKETDEYLASLKNSDGKTDMVAYNAKVEDDRKSFMQHASDSSDQIVESTVSNTHAGETVANAAPIMTVATGDLHKTADSTQEKKQPENTIASEKKPSRTAESGGVLIKQAYAEENSDLPPPATEKQAPEKKTTDKPVSTEQPANIEPVAASPEKTAKNSASGPAVVEPESNDLTKPPVFTLKSKPAQKATTVELASHKKAKAAAATTLDDTQAAGQFYIQAGSFAAEENARKLSAKLTSISNVDTGKVDVGTKTWWRVRMGPFASRQIADAALAKVRAEGVADARIVNP